MPKVLDVEVANTFKRIARKCETEIREAEELEANDYELDYLVENLKGALEEVQQMANGALS